MFYILLPVLVFEAAWQLKPKLLKRWLWPILLLATVGVLVSCALVAVGVYVGINHPGFPWIAAFLTGSILAATDPIAVVSALKRLKAPEDLATLFEGESLFNDASAVVLFSLVLGIATAMLNDGQLSSGFTLDALGRFITVFFGGMVVGSVMGLLAAIVVLLLAQKSAANIVLFTTAFASFYVAEHVLHVSGIMSVMMAALLTRFLLREQEENLLADTLGTWEFLGLLFNTLVFVLMGLVVELSMFTEQWLAIIIAIIASLIARFVVVLLLGRLSQFSTRPISMGWQLVLAWGGLRGAVSIALVLSIPTSLPYWWTLQSMVFGVVIFTLLVQGPTSAYLIRRFGSQ